MSWFSIWPRGLCDCNLFPLKIKRKKKLTYSLQTYANLSNIKMSPRRNNIKKSARITNKVRRSWNAKEKLMVICYYEHVKNVRATARRFEIEPKQVREWVKKKQDLLNVAPYILTLNHGCQAHFPLLEEKLVEWNKY